MDLKLDSPVRFFHSNLYLVFKPMRPFCCICCYFPSPQESASHRQHWVVICPVKYLVSRRSLAHTHTFPPRVVKVTLLSDALPCLWSWVVVLVEFQGSLCETALDELPEGPSPSQCPHGLSGSRSEGIRPSNLQPLDWGIVQAQVWWKGMGFLRRAEPLFQVARPSVWGTWYLGAVTHCSGCGVPPTVNKGLGTTGTPFISQTTCPMV